MAVANPNDVENPPVPSPKALLLDELKTLFVPSPSRCIYRVPDRFRRVREEDYIPRVISIGPFHHGREALKAMEVHKKRYVKCFLTPTNLQLEDCFGRIEARVEQLRSCYGEKIEFESDVFVKIILVDAIFLIEFLRRFLDSKLQDENDCIFGNPRMVYDVVPDLLMLENQLPFFILEELYPPIKKLSIDFLSFQGAAAFGRSKNLSDGSPGLEGKHFVDLLRKQLIAPREESSSKDKLTRSVAAPSMERLHQTGVKFVVIKLDDENCTTNLFGIEFDHGTLKIPKLQCGDWTELVLRNLIAFEQCSPTSDDYYISDYVSIMDELVDTPRDAELLVENGIVENNLGGGDHELSSLINRLSTGLLYDEENFNYGELSEKLQNFHSSKWHKWMAILRRNYFNNPWLVISFVAGVVLLLLTAIQTVFSVK